MGGLKLMFPLLETLNISYCRELTNTGLVNLMQMFGNKLKHLKLALYQLETADSLRSLQQQFPYLQILKLVRCIKLNDMGLVNLLQMSGDRLNHLELDNNQEVTGDSLAGRRLQFPNLEILNISNYCKLTDMGLVNLLQMSGDKLKHLKLSHNELVTGHSLSGIGLQFLDLETLNISFCKKLTDIGLFNLMEMSSNKLVNLDLSYCSQLSADGLREIRMIPKGQLKTLNFRGIPNLSSILKEELRDHVKKN